MFLKNFIENCAKGNMSGVESFLHNMGAYFISKKTLKYAFFKACKNQQTEVFRRLYPLVWHDAQCQRVAYQCFASAGDLETVKFIESVATHQLPVEIEYVPGHIAVHFAQKYKYHNTVHFDVLSHMIKRHDNTYLLELLSGWQPEGDELPSVLDAGKLFRLAMIKGNVEITRYFFEQGMYISHLYHVMDQVMTAENFKMIEYLMQEQNIDIERYASKYLAPEVKAFIYTQTEKIYARTEKGILSEVEAVKPAKKFKL